MKYIKTLIVDTFINKIKKNYDFFGWGMSTLTHTPWGNFSNSDLGKSFSETNRILKTKVKSKEFILSQQDLLTDKDAQIDELAWRHYIIFWSVVYASKFSKSADINLAECGVCDGMTTFFALSSSKSDKIKMFLYDAWEGMKAENLLKSESNNINNYDYLDVENTKRNLKDFSNRIVFNKGYIPDSFKSSVNPEKLSWLHIDLNSSIATKAALDYFFGKIVPGGVILFDDYSHRGYEDTMKMSDNYFEDKDGILMPIPTGQAIFFKKG